MEHYRAIILAVASDNQPVYKFFRKLLQTYLDLNPSIKVFLTYGKGTTFERMEHDIIFDDIKEDPGKAMIIKTIRSMEYITENYDYDYLIRTNMSTFWDFKTLLKRLDSLPKERCLAGSRLGWYPPPYIVGTGLIVDKGMVIDLIKNQHLILTPERLASKLVGTPEDRVFSEFFSNVLGAKLRPLNSIFNIETLNTPDEEEIRFHIQTGKSLGVDHFRIKNEGPLKDVKQRADSRLSIDPVVGNLLCMEYYNKVVDW